MPPQYGAASASSTSSSSSDDEEEEHEVAPPPNPKPKPPAAAPSSSDEEESGSGEEEAAPPPPDPKPTTAAKPASSSDEEESGSSDDDDAPPASNPAPAVSASPVPPPSATPSAAKSKAFQRTWTDEDEIALLRGMLLYSASNGVLVSTNSDMKQFHQFIQGSLQTEVRPSQLFDKVRRFKAKYQKTRDKGESPSSAKPHDAAIYELSRKIWGTERVKPENGNAKESRAAKRHKGHETSNGAEERNGDAAVAQVPFHVRYPYLAEAVSRMGASIQSGFLLNEVIGLVDASEAMALDNRHKKLVMMQVDLINDTAALIKKATENMF